MPRCARRCAVAIRNITGRKILSPPSRRRRCALSAKNSLGAQRFLEEVFRFFTPTFFLAGGFFLEAVFFLITVFFLAAGFFFVTRFFFEGAAFFDLFAAAFTAFLGAGFLGAGLFGPAGRDFCAPAGL